MFMLSRDIKRRISSIFKSRNANQSKIDAGLKSGDGLWTLECYNSKE